MCENNLRPSIIMTLSDIEKEIKNFGLSERDLIILLQSRIKIKDKYNKPIKMGQKQIKAVLDGLKDFEKELIQNRIKKLRNPYVQFVHFRKSLPKSKKIQ